MRDALLAGWRVRLCDHADQVIHVTHASQARRIADQRVCHWNRKVESKARVARMKAALRRSGTRKRRSLALVVSTTTTAAATARSLAVNQRRDRPSDGAFRL